MLNDENLKDFGRLLIQEPHCFLDDTNKPVASPICHTYWNQFLPSNHVNDRYPIRSLIWVHKDIQARQVPIPSPDLTAVLITIQDRKILAFSVYIPPIGPTARQDLTSRVEAIKTTIISTTNQYNREIELVIAGDFNRHDQLWGGDGIATTVRQGEAADIIHLLYEFDLQSLLPRGTITFEAYQGESTIDLCLTTEDSMRTKSVANLITPSMDLTTDQSKPDSQSKLPKIKRNLAVYLSQHHGSISDRE